MILFQGNQFFGRDHDDDGSIHMESISQRGGKENWDDIGLSNNPLNDRYFSQVLYSPLIGQNYMNTLFSLVNYFSLTWTG